MVAKLRAARERKRALTGKGDGHKSKRGVEFSAASIASMLRRWD